MITLVKSVSVRKRSKKSDTEEGNKTALVSIFEDD